MREICSLIKKQEQDSPEENYLSENSGRVDSGCNHQYETEVHELERENHRLHQELEDMRIEVNNLQTMGDHSR